MYIYIENTWYNQNFKSGYLWKCMFTQKPVREW